MKPLTPPNGKCLQGGRDECPLACKYNHFESDDLTIDAWELKCMDCGWRDTVGFRSDESDDGENLDPTQCPFCEKIGMQPGTRPCETCETSAPKE